MGNLDLRIEAEANRLLAEIQHLVLDAIEELGADEVERRLHALVIFGEERRQEDRRIIQRASRKQTITILCTERHPTMANVFCLRDPHHEGDHNSGDVYWSQTL